MDLRTVGRIGRPHGIRGEVLVEVRTDDPDERFAPGKVLIAEPGASPSDPAAYRVPDRLTVEAVRAHQGRLIVVFEGVYDRNVAEALRGVVLSVDSADIADPTDPDEFNDHQLVGLAAVTTSGETLGEVVRIDHAPASDMLVLRRPEGRTALVPFVKAIVPEVDLAGGRVVVDPPEGLLDL
ncbi:ribosome maturation factor RimM [Phytohabitans aurantiacus]|jgi:16S rRNA processing protein RimM|uniref:Ribosome maturation factor RimM n=1 Tax=Phytohabitans aurantiacus TaxID=3016789 RepID=A0ABQ5QPL8_9ACTN|nr:ribosome maturation factor RimM [Phytohabitans aurantiacus]GLH96184.1 ribosome maturation factor RimM [Phytohabitans aurantiacus]